MPKSHFSTDLVQLFSRILTGTLNFISMQHMRHTTPLMAAMCVVGHLAALRTCISLSGILEFRFVICFSPSSRSELAGCASQLRPASAGQLRMKYYILRRGGTASGIGFFGYRGVLRIFNSSTGWFGKADGALTVSRDVASASFRIFACSLLWALPTWFLENRAIPPAPDSISPVGKDHYRRWLIYWALQSRTESGAFPGLNNRPARRRVLFHSIAGVLRHRGGRVFRILRHSKKKFAFVLACFCLIHWCAYNYF